MHGSVALCVFKCDPVREVELHSSEVVHECVNALYSETSLMNKLLLLATIVGGAAADYRVKFEVRTSASASAFFWSILRETHAIAG